MAENAMSWYLDKMLSKLPNDPIVQTQYIYYLTTIITATLFTFMIQSFWIFFTTWAWGSFFGGILLFCFFAMSLFSLKATRQAYKGACEIKLGMDQKLDKALEEGPEQWEQKTYIQ